MRKEREKQRELEKQREREREKERERFICERKEKAEEERREREREREQLERERLQRERDRLERERLERERKEREQLEAERIERERQERDRLERERLERERIEQERATLEKERLERERYERERRSSDRGYGSSSMKRPSVGDNRGYVDNKRSLRDDPRDATRNSFFGASNNSDSRAARPGGYLQDELYDMAYQRRSGAAVARDHRSDSRGDVKNDLRRRDSRESAPKPRESEDVRRVVDRYPSSRDRSPHRGVEPPKYRDTDRNADYGRNNWLDAPNPNAPKTLSDVLGRAGLTGILGTQAESGGGARSYSPRREESHRDVYRDEGSSHSIYKLDNRIDDRRPVRIQDDRRDFRSDDRRDVRGDDRRDVRPDDRKDVRVDDRREVRHDTRREPHLDDRRDLRYEDRGRENPRTDDRRDVNPRDRREGDYRDNRALLARDTRGNERRDGRITDDRREPRHDERRDSRSDRKPLLVDRGIGRGLLPASSQSQSITDRRGLHPLAAELTSSRPSLPTVLPARVVPVAASVFGRPVQAAPGAAALHAGYTTASQAITIHQVPTGIQLRDGRLEFTRIAPPGANIQPFPTRRF